MAIRHLSGTSLPRRSRWSTLLVTSLSLGLFGGLVALTGPADPALAHCDAVGGPVVTAARDALDSGEVDRVLPYVQPEAEGELTAAFEQSLAVRADGGAAQDLADRWFFETAVRLHREGEGAPYTGLKEHADFGPALEAADSALESGSLDEVSAVLQNAVDDGLAARYAELEAARQHATREPSLAADRARVESELAFEQYVDAIYTATQAQPHAAGEAGHDAAHATTATDASGVQH
jgi:hypothetical protein